FFQAEDGIRDRNVTGVQTCALPIFRQHPARRGRRQAALGGPGAARPAELAAPPAVRGRPSETRRLLRTSRRACGGPRRRRGSGRSEERRVGKVGGGGGATEQWRKMW